MPLTSSLRPSTSTYHPPPADSLRTTSHVSSRISITAPGGGCSVSCCCSKVTVATLKEGWRRQGATGSARKRCDYALSRTRIVGTFWWVASGLWKSGRARQYRSPTWRALELMVGSRQLSEYMWMHEVLLEDGHRLQSYKHVRSRRYLHVDESGKRWLFRHGRYKKVA